LRAALAALGAVRHVVGPNRWHDEGLREFQAAYPEAEFHAAPGLARDRRDVHFARELGATPPAAWADVLDQHLVQGMPSLNEVVFLHRASRSLILADLALNVGPPGGTWERWLYTLAGAWGQFGPTRLGRRFMRDRAAVRASVEHVLRWDFERVIVGHGRNLETGGRAAVRAAFAFLP
jgi:hypothetical protein